MSDYRRISTALIILVIALPLSRAALGQDTEVPIKAPKIWDEQQLADWGLPLAAIQAQPKYITEQAYYASPVDNLRTYPVYHPDRQPPGYLESLLQKEPQKLVEPGLPRTQAQWIELGKRVFEEWDHAPARTTDPKALAYLRDPDALEKDHTTVAADGTIPGFRWVVEKKGKVSLGLTECARCHVKVTADGSAINGAPGNLQGGAVALNALLAEQRKHFYAKQPVTKGQAAYYDYHVPWQTDDVNAKMKSMTDKQMDEIVASFVPGTFPLANGSPYAMTKLRDLRGLSNEKYLDATATHRNRGPEDVARYAALISYADHFTFGDHQSLPDDHPRPLFHVPDDALYALGLYLYALEPLPNPNAADADATIVARGKVVFESMECARCHTGPNYGGELLTPAEEFDVPDEYLDTYNIFYESAYTDSNLAMNTRKGTGLYKVPSLRGLWYRGLYGHSGSCASLEDWFNLQRFENDYVPTGWKGPGVKNRAVLGHPFGLEYLTDEDIKALIVFLKTL